MFQNKNTQAFQHITSTDPVAARARAQPGHMWLVSPSDTMTPAKNYITD